MNKTYRVTVDITYNDIKEREDRSLRDFLEDCWRTLHTNETVAEDVREYFGASVDAEAPSVSVKEIASSE